MNITQLSKFGYKLTDVLSAEDLEYFNNLADSFTPTSIRQPYDSPDVKCPDPSSIREVFQLNDVDKEKIVSYFKEVHTIVDEQYRFGGIEVWRDYPGYNHEMHYDFDFVKHVVVLYLGGTGQSEMGTYYYEDDKLLGVDYERNSAILLLNSNKVKHGMLGSVPSTVPYRKTLYFNWLDAN